MCRPFFISALLLLSSIGLGQNPPDFSGVFLRVSLSDNFLNSVDKEPMVFQVKQFRDRIEATITQNGATSSTSYALNGPTATRILGVPATGKAKFKKQNLLVEFTIKEPSAVPIGAKAVKISEKWTLSGDRQTLIIVRRYDFPDLGANGLRATEIYHRRDSLELALSDAAAESVFKCQTTGSPAEDERVFKLNEGAFLGYGWLDRLSAHVLFDAVISSDEFKDVERVRTKTGFEFRKKGQSVSEYPDSVVVEIEPVYSESKPWMLGQQPPPSYFSHSSKVPVPKEFLQLRFHLVWLGSKKTWARCSPNF